jgi:hypothetical protein
MQFHELEKPFHQNISEGIANTLKKLKENLRPGTVLDLLQEPTKDDLKFLINNHANEIGLARLVENKQWKIIEGARKMIPSTEIDGMSDISAHSHPRIDKSYYLPSFDDVVYINPGKNFIIFDEGITYFSEIKKHPITEHSWKPSIYLGIGTEQLRELYWSFIHYPGLSKCKIKEEFYGKMGVTIIRKSWGELPDNPLSNF